ncbi:MAG: hypothetical protein DSY80_02865 [Desulfocapsa sp.]|nr:MAG: hypothetical protein DSY80_02865 [Desulfocapsa sp.]
MPKTEDEWKVVADEFRRKWNFPHAIGAIDGKHVSIKKPPGSGSFYYNYKGFFSIVLMAVVNANYEFLMVDAGINGRVSDGGVISYSTFGRMMEQNKLCIPASEKLHENDNACLPFVFLADDAFSLGENLMKPYGGEGAGKLDLSQCIYNYRVSRARRVVENAFGILVSRFGVFERAIKLAPEKAKSITLACCYLHNYLRKRSGSYVASGTVDWEDDNGVVHQGSWRESQRNLEGLRATYGRNASAQAKYYRDLYKEYFNSKGAVPWQKERCTWLN